MAVNKVVYGDQTIIDLSDSTLSSGDQILSGTTAYDRSGVLRSGTAQVGTKVYNGDDTSDPLYPELFMETVVSGVTNVLLNTFYPVGSIYMSVNSTNPSTLFGGTWVQLEDRFLLGAGSTYTAGATGGNAKRSEGFIGVAGSTYGTEGSQYKGRFLVVDGNHTNNITSMKTISGYSDLGFMPPYLVVYMWQRTA